MKTHPVFLFMLPVLALLGPHTASAQQNTIECGSINQQFQRCALDVSGGVELLSQISRALCDQDRTWGYDDQGLWVKDGCRGVFTALAPSGDQAVVARHSPVVPRPPGPMEDDKPADQIAEVYCASNRNRYQHCDTDTRGRSMHLVHEFSDDACRYGSTWGYNSRGIWVDRGCVGLFRMKRRHVPPPRIDRMVCESDGNQRVSCPVARPVSHVALLRQLSSAECKKGRAWGFARGALWVKDGCGGMFEIIEAGTGYPNWMYGSFEGIDPRHNHRISLTVQSNGNVRAQINGRWVHGELDGDLLDLDGIPYELAKTQDGFRAENTHSSRYRSIHFKRLD